MSDTVLAIIELERFPNDVASRAAWIARRFGCDLELVLSDPTIAVLRDSFIVSNEAQLIADHIKEAQERILAELARTTPNHKLEIRTTVLEHSRSSQNSLSKAPSITALPKEHDSLTPIGA